jgi:hypothetical protein
LTIGGSAAGNRHDKRDLVALRERLPAARVAAGHDRQRRVEPSGDPGLENAETLEKMLDRRALRQRDAQPGGPGCSGKPGSKSHLDLHRVPRESLPRCAPYSRSSSRDKRVAQRKRGIRA